MLPFIFLLVKTDFSEKVKSFTEIKENVIMKFTALTFLEVVSLPWCDDLVIQKCALVWEVSFSCLKNSAIVAKIPL